MKEYYERNLLIYANKLFVECIDEFFNGRKPNEIYHYTSTEVLDKILSNATFRASNIFYLNDSKEYVNGIETLERMLEEQKCDDVNDSNINNKIKELIKKIAKSDGKSFPGLYTISFSEAEDSLHQWVTYARESGVALELDYNLLQKTKNGIEWKLKQDIENEEKSGSVDIRIMKPLKYRTKSDSEIDFSKSWTRILTNMDDLPSEKEKEDVSEITLRMLASHIKDKKFTSEAEVRISTFPIQLRDTHTKINYFPTKGILRPYIDISFGYYENENFIKNIPIRSITIGPSGKQQTVFDSVVHRLKYGKNCIYQYDLQDISKKLTTYCDLIHDFYSRQTETSPLDNDAIKFHWFEEHKTFLCSNFGNKSLDSIMRKLDINKVELSNEQRTKLYSIGNDFCLTKEGVIIKKSTTPYIF